MSRAPLPLLCLLLIAGGARADDTAQDEAVALDRLTVLGRRANLVGEAISASQGRVGPDEIGTRPRARAGDLLEFVPGLVATQHSGSGKANQYFLRGFNLDHGTDFATFVDAMPVNLRTHGHGQGYTDLNFLIPELVQELDYRKGTYYADVGDFSSAGSARFALADELPRGLVEADAGEHGYRRALLADSVALGAGALLYAAERQTADGPWRDIDEDVRRSNLVLRYSVGAGRGRAHVSAMHYDNAWNSPDQIPQRAVAQGLIDALGSLDTTLGGEARRSSLSGGWRGAAFGGSFDASAYAIEHELALWSNFTYFLDDPEHGDQFQQFDRRRVGGFELAQRWQAGAAQWTLGAQGRRDDIGAVGLRRSERRAPRATVREDAVDERSLGLYATWEQDLGPRLRAHLGARHDRYGFEVDAGDPRNGGEVDDDATSLKAALVYTPSDPLELYLSVGQGFHSNDARGTTITVDPVSGAAAAPVDPLVASHGAELGARLYLSERVHATAALWRLELDSELLFVGDAGTTEASRPSSRQGVELGLYWFGGGALEADLELSYTDARFDDADPAGAEIPGAIPLVLGAGVTARFGDDWFASARLRHFGAYPLIEDDSVESDGSTLVNLRLGREWERWSLSLDLLNALDSRDHDIDYYYASRLPGEPGAGVDDLHFHAFEPRTLRASVRWAF
jgi:hypothetical protein